MKRIKVWCQTMKGSNIQLQWIDPVTLARRSKTSGTLNEAEAERMRADLEYELNNGGSVPHRMTWDKFKELFIEEYLPGVRIRTGEKYLTVMRTFEDIVRPSTMIRIDERTLSRFVMGMRRRKRSKMQTGLKPWTQCNYLKAMHKILGWAMDMGFIRTMPKFPTVKVPRLRPKPVATEDFDVLIAAAPDDAFRAFLLLGWMAGLRLSEAYQLRRKPSKDFPWVDRKANKIHLPATFVKAGEDQWVPIKAELLIAIDGITIDSKYPDRYFVFRSKHKKARGRLISPGAAGRRVVDLAKRAEVPLTMHKLRKGFGCRLAKQLGKGAAGVLHRLMRHSSMQLTMDFYANVDDALQGAVDDLE